MTRAENMPAKACNAAESKGNPMMRMVDRNGAAKPSVWALWRLIMVDQLLSIAFSIAPRDHPDTERLAKCLLDYTSGTVDDAALGRHRDARESKDGCS